MQEAANKGKDAGRCPVCGRVCRMEFVKVFRHLIEFRHTDVSMETA